LGKRGVTVDKEENEKDEGDVHSDEKGVNNRSIVEKKSKKLRSLS